MKKCPHCGQTFDFRTYASWFSSDKLLSHAPQAHPREHLCPHCRHRLWVHYHHATFVRLFRQYLLASFGLSVIASACLLWAGLPISLPHAALFTVFLVFTALPVLVYYARYRSAHIKEEETADTFGAAAASKE